MRILLLGATGLIGSAVAARLRGEGHDVDGVARVIDSAARRVPVARWIRLDLRSMLRSGDWLPHLAGIDAVVNCAGVLQDSPRDSVGRVHDEAPRALWQACQQSGVRRVVQISAIGVDRGSFTDFSRTKARGDAALAATGLDWVILRPSVVIGRPAYGGTSLFRGLAALPVVPKVPGAGPLDVVQLDEVVESVAFFLRDGAPSRITLELAGPDRLSVADVIAAYRRWFGWRPAHALAVPGWLLAPFWRLGDLVSWLGWRPPLRTTARRELECGAVGDPGPWIQLTGVRPQSLDKALAANPASVQDRWFARLLPLKPLALGSFALFWLLTGLVSLGPGWDRAVDMMKATAAARWAEISVVGGALLDLAIGTLMLFRGTAKLALLAALVTTLLYLLLGTVLAPWLWADPLGPMMKVWPILVFNLLCLAILDDR